MNEYKILTYKSAGAARAGILLEDRLYDASPGRLYSRDVRVMRP